MQDEPTNGESLPLTKEDWKRHRESTDYIRTISTLFIGCGVLMSFAGFDVVETVLASGLWFAFGIAGLLLAKHQEAHPPRRRRKQSRRRVREAHIQAATMSVILVSAGVVVGTLWDWNWGSFLILVGGGLLVALVVEWVKSVTVRRRELKKRDEAPNSEEQQDYVPPSPAEPRPAKWWHIGCGLILVAAALAAGVWSLAVSSEFGAGPIAFAVVLALRIRHDWLRRNALTKKAEPD